MAVQERFKRLWKGQFGFHAVVVVIRGFFWSQILALNCEMGKNLHIRARTMKLSGIIELKVPCFCAIASQRLILE